MPRSLQTYHQKRDFSVTQEPRGSRSRKQAGRAEDQQALSFVIQKHAARRLHYDFRLELDGTLKSWAVPKGPSLDPLDKRMAVHVEDHPLDYADFEGVIPPKQYGAGTVIVWDKGEWIPQGNPRQGYAAGKLKFELRGTKLQGHWTLVRMRKGADDGHDNWLLIKEQDEHARSASQYNVVEALPDSVLTQGQAPAARSSAKKADMPLTLAPQLATLVDQTPTQAGWIFEMKFDGYRLLARLDQGQVKLFTRNGHDWTAKMPNLARAIAKLPAKQAWLDGEIIVQGDNGAPDFQRLQNAFEGAHTDQIQYFVFDLLYLDGRDLRDAPLSERREILRQMLAHASASAVHFSEDFSVAPQHLLQTACDMHLEGVIGKRQDGVYRSGRSTDWIKLKCKQRQEFVIGGYTDPKGSREGLGALFLGVHDPQGQLRYAGQVGTGFSAQTLHELKARLDTLRAERMPFDAVPQGVKGHWVKPTLAAEVSFAQWTKDGLLRQAVFHGLRQDKPARSITREHALHMNSRPSSAIKISHADRVVDPSTGITKGELASYYDTVAPLILPHLIKRPVSLVRAPDGLNGELFFQKHGQKLQIPDIHLLDPALDSGHDPLLEVASSKALVGCIQMNVVEFHTWNARVQSIDKPDRFVLDLDPGEGVSWARMQQAAELVRVLLSELELQSWLKTSGGKGLHVVVPIAARWSWDQVKGLSQALVVHLARTFPDRFASKSGPKNRVGKIFVDYLRNGRGATTAAAWSVRARPGLGVSVPVAWDELSALKGGAQWSLRTVSSRLSTPDPWAEFWSCKQSIRPALQAMEDAKTLSQDRGWEPMPRQSGS